MTTHWLTWTSALLLSGVVACADDTTERAEQPQREEEHAHDGEPAADGEDGEDGEDGSEGAPGARGPSGEDGADGRDGADGTSCTIEHADGTASLVCSDGARVELPAAHGEEHEPPRGRLFFGDELAGGVRALDLETGEIIASFAEVAVGASLYASESGRFISVVQGALHRVSFLDSGLVATAEGSAHEQLPRLLDYSMEGAELGAVTPIHVDSHHGYITVHFDGRYDAMVPANHVPARNFVIEEHELLEPEPSITVAFETEPQHGLSIVTEEGLVIVSAPTTDRSISASPNGFTVHELSGELLQTIHDPEDFLASCWGMHGEAEVGGDLLFGCHESLDGGIMVLTWDEALERYEARKITYPGYPDAMRRTSVLKGHPASAYAVGQWGYTGQTSQYTGLVRIDPEADAVSLDHVLDLGAVYCDFDFERGEGQRVLALARDGRVHSVDVESWASHKTVQLVAPSETGCGARMIVGDGVAYLTVAETGEIVELDATSLEVRRSFVVGGRPRNMTLALPAGHDH